jgi:hypothetical protein
VILIIGDIYNLEINEYRLFLAKPNKTIITEIGDFIDFKLEKQLLGLDTLEFTIPFYITDTQGLTYKNPSYDLLFGDYLILLEYNSSTQWFLIENPSVNYSDKGDDKKVFCRSFEYILSKKKVADFETDATVLYSTPPNELGILNQLLPLQKVWSIGSVDVDLNNIYRSFNTSEDNLYECFNKLSEIFSVVFFFDTVNEVINIIRVENLPSINRGLVLSDENLIESYSEVINTENIVTKLYAYGDSDLSINGVTTTGQSYIENLSYYKNTNFMTQSLIDAQNAYESLLLSKQGDFENSIIDLNAQYTLLYGNKSQSIVIQTIPEYTYTRNAILYTIPSRQIEITTYNTGLIGELDMLNIELEAEEIKRDIAIQLKEYGYTYNSTIINNLKAQIAAKQVEIDDVNADIAVINATIQQIGTDLALENNFTTGQLEERDLFIREGIYKNSDIIDEDDLLNEATTNLALLSQPAIEFKLDVTDFLSIVEYQHQWDKLTLGDIVNILHVKNNSLFEVRLIGYEHDQDGNLSLEFSNRNNLYDSKLYMQELLKQASSTSSSVEYKKSYWSEGGETKLNFDTFLGSAFDASNQGIVTGDNQHVSINNRGIQLESGGDDPAQLRICNNVIAFSTDAFETTDLAITPQGIFSNSFEYMTIRGDLYVAETKNKN